MGCAKGELMDKSTLVYRVYIGALILMGLVTLMVVLGQEEDVRAREALTGYETIRMNESPLIQNPEAPGGCERIYIWRVNGVEGPYCTLLFYTYHANVEMFLDGERVYRGMPAYHNKFGSTRGTVWNELGLFREDNGKLLKVRIVPSYAGGEPDDITFYFGRKYAIFRSMVQKDIFAYFIGGFTVVIGAFYLLYFRIFSRNKQFQDRDTLVALGLFSIMIGFWRLTNLPSVTLLLPGKFVLSVLPFLFFLASGIPMVLYFRSLVSFQDSSVWICLWGLNFGEIALCVLGHLTKFLDFQEALPLIQFVYVATLGICFSTLFIEARQKGITPRIRRVIIGMGVLVCLTIIDFALYVFMKDYASGTMSMLGLLIFDIIQGGVSMERTKALVDKGQEAQKFEAIAYHDQLTGLFNRAAFIYDTAQEEFVAEHCTAVAFDLNNLKKCNDTLGHEKGDLYIKESSRIIQKHFGAHGAVYRMGGDEFACLLHEKTMEQIRQMVAGIHKDCEEWNKKSKDIVMQIACGYQLFDPRIDYDIADTMRRADKEMYRDKYRLKHNGEEPGQETENIPHI